ncbi:hypothetical protein N431DRAFT_492879 [Stipitochalara longipes BDJ]|nr:hypothetical protein N431DRAFT_492879 [Stipitochalara longipes BDJ]
MPAMLTQCRGDWRHTSGGDKYDLKKVITTRFKSGRGTTIATCHAHGDGTWNLLFSPAGKAHLSKMGIFSAVEDALEVTVLQRIDDEGRVFHYGEMIKKPDVCRRPVSENNDERHRLKQLELKEMDRKGFTQLFPRTIRLVEESIDEDANDEVFEARNASTISTGRKGSQHLWKSHYRKDGNILTPEQEQLAVDLSKENMSSKEQRCLFQRIKTMPSDQQQLTLERSKALKTAAEHDR